MEYTEFDHNLRRKAEAKQYPIEKKYRIKDEQTFAKYEYLKDELDQRTRKYSDQALIEFIINIAFHRFQKIKKKDNELSEIGKEDL